MESRWRVHQRAGGSLLEHLCAIRGFDPLNLVPDFTTQLHDPNLLPDMEAARALIRQAVSKAELVVIFGDYDADGTPAAALLSRVMTRLGVTHQVILPTRQQGYGLRRETIDNLPKATKLLITVDTGISSVEEIKLARSRGIDVIVLDHHLPGRELPDANALIDPFLENSRYPFAGLCGCALAYKLTEALAQDFPERLNEAFRKWLLDLVAIATVADMMSLRDENRTLVHYGLQVLRKTRRPGLKALLEIAGLTPDKLNSSSIGYVIGPRLNASGRINDNAPALRLLTTDDANEARALAEEIEANNYKRQRAVSNVLEEAGRLLFTQNAETDRCLVVYGDDWPTGVVGLVAGKLASQYNRPVVALAGHGDAMTGSARSSGDYSIIEGLESNRAVLSRFGGHRQAAGLSLAREDLPKFVDGLKAHAAKKITAADLVPTHTAEATLTPDELTLEVAGQIERLAPFGQENPQPLLLVKNVQLGPAKIIGQTGDHVKLAGRTGQAELDIIGFGLAKRIGQFLDQADLLGHLEVNQWRDRRTLQLRLVDFRSPGSDIVIINNLQSAAGRV